MLYISAKIVNNERFFIQQSTFHSLRVFSGDFAVCKNICHGLEFSAVEGRYLNENGHKIKNIKNMPLI